MTENASLSDYLFELRRGTAPARLGMAIGVGVLFVVVGLFLGPRFAGLTGLGLAIAGVCAWARLNQIADAMMDGRFVAPQPARGRQLRAVGVAALGVGAVGTLLFLYSFLARFVLVSTGM
jgi:hypothetical protein